MSDEMELHRDDDAGEYQLWLSGERMGYATFHRQRDTVAIPSMVIDPALRGRGWGEKLAHYVLTDIEAAGAKVDPICPFMSAYLRRHPEFQKLVHGQE